MKKIILITMLLLTYTAIEAQNRVNIRDFDGIIQYFYQDGYLYYSDGSEVAFFFDGSIIKSYAFKINVYSLAWDGKNLSRNGNIVFNWDGVYIRKGDYAQGRKLFKLDNNTLYRLQNDEYTKGDGYASVKYVLESINGEKIPLAYLMAIAYQSYAAESINN
jgi:hypothetical protein